MPMPAGLRNIRICSGGWQVRLIQQGKVEQARAWALWGFFPELLGMPALRGAALFRPLVVPRLWLLSASQF